MKDILKDIVAHTHSLGLLEILKIRSENNNTYIDARADNRSVVLSASTHSPIPDFDTTFGMSNLEKLNLHLKNPEYQENAKIEVIKSDRNGETIPTHIHFENEAGDFQNDYRFMSRAIIDERMKDVIFKGAKWVIEFTPSIASIGRMKLMSAAHSEDPIFNVSTKTTGSKIDLIFSFGDAGSHAGEFIFQNDVDNKLQHTWSWPISVVQSILTLPGDIIMKISDEGAMVITVDSGMAKYDYILPAQAK